MRELGISDNDLIVVISSIDYFECVDRMDELKVRAKKAFHKVAFDLHPDRNNNDIEKIERFKTALMAAEYIESLYIVPCQICIQQGRKI